LFFCYYTQNYLQIQQYIKRVTFFLRKIEVWEPKNHNFEFFYFISKSVLISLTSDVDPKTTDLASVLYQLNTEKPKNRYIKITWLPQFFFIFFFPFCNILFTLKKFRNNPPIISTEYVLDFGVCAGEIETSSHVSPPKSHSPKSKTILYKSKLMVDMLVILLIIIKHWNIRYKIL
jgi:hypothetical protein